MLMPEKAKLHTHTHMCALETATLLLVIKDVLTIFGNSRERKEQQATRKEMMLDKFSLAQSMDIYGNVVRRREDPVEWWRLAIDAEESYSCVRTCEAWPSGITITITLTRLSQRMG